MDVAWTGTLPPTASNATVYRQLFPLLRKWMPCSFHEAEIYRGKIPFAEHFCLSEDPAESSIAHRDAMQELQVVGIGQWSCRRMPSACSPHPTSVLESAAEVSDRDSLQWCDGMRNCSPSPGTRPAISVADGMSFFRGLYRYPDMLDTDADLLRANIAELERLVQNLCRIRTSGIVFGAFRDYFGHDGDTIWRLLRPNRRGYLDY